MIGYHSRDRLHVALYELKQSCDVFTNYILLAMNHLLKTLCKC